MNVLMAQLADDQGLAPARGHAPDPERFFSLAWSVQVREFPDMVDFTLHHGAAQFTALRQQALDHLTARAEDLRWLIVEDSLLVPSELNAAKSGDQGLFALASFVLYLQDRERAMGGRHCGPILAVDPVDTRAMLVGEGLHQGQLHGPVNTPEAMHVVRQQ